MTLNQPFSKSLFVCFIVNVMFLQMWPTEVAAQSQPVVAIGGTIAKCGNLLPGQTLTTTVKGSDTIGNSCKYGIGTASHPYIITQKQVCIGPHLSAPQFVSKRYSGWTGKCAVPLDCNGHAHGTSWNATVSDPNPKICVAPLVGYQTCTISSLNTCVNGTVKNLKSVQSCTTKSCYEMPISHSDAFLLLSKTGFQPIEAEIQKMQSYKTRRAAVTALINGLSTNFSVSPPRAVISDGSTRWTEANFPQNWASSDRFGTSVNSFKSWYVSDLIATSSPFSARLGLFWHNHFTSSLSLLDPWYMFQQHKAIRKNLTGSFATMLSDLTHNPNMLIYLNQVSSRATPPVVSNGKVTKEAVYPIANFARELLELFTIGNGNYNEQDVTVASYALTGLNYDYKTGHYLYKPADHYDFKSNWAKIPEPVKLLGNTVDTPEDVLKVLLTEPKHYAATRIVTKLWKEFVSGTPNAAVIDVIAKKFQDPKQYNYAIKPVLYDLLMTDDFWNVKGSLVKSPAEYVVGIVRELALPVSGNLSSFVSAISAMGMGLFDPPNVRGYLGGTEWLNTYTLSKRQSYAFSYASQWSTEVFGTTVKVPNITNYGVFVTPRLTSPYMLNPPTNRYITIVEAQQQVLSDPAYSLK